MFLIVDDEPGVCVAFSVALRQAGVAAASAGCVTEAMHALAKPGWTGFILDIFLPDGTGLQLLEKIRRDPVLRHLPVAIITADILLDETVVNRIAALGATLHMGVFNRDRVQAICLEVLITRS